MDTTRGPACVICQRALSPAEIDRYHGYCRLCHEDVRKAAKAGRHSAGSVQAGPTATSSASASRFSPIDRVLYFFYRLTWRQILLIWAVVFGCLVGIVSIPSLVFYLYATHPTPEVQSGTLRLMSVYNRLLPRMALPHTLRCMVLRDQGHIDEALNACTAGVEVRPLFAIPYEARGMLLLRRGRWREAELDFSEALQQEPSHYAALFHRGVARLKQELFAEAAADFSRYISATAAGKGRSMPFFPAAHRCRAVALSRLGDANGAAHDLETVRFLVPQGEIAGSRMCTE